MVTFSIPGDDVVEVTNGTPRSRPPLPFAKRAYAAASPFGSSSAKRQATPHASSSRKLLTTRDEVPSSSLNRSSIATARNIFRASAISDSPPTSTFSPSIPNSTMKKVFAPGATPEPSRVYREFIAHATPRGMAAKTSTKELFPMRIASPPPELTGEVLTHKIPKEWNAKGSIYADQFLAHLCPPELDEEQRRQFFCILDLRRLKYAANEIFAKKDWKLNVINFAKEFEKSRSIILLRYGLYEFQNVKPSKDVLKRWRREHGLPEPEEEEANDESTPSRPTSSKKRKAADDDSATPATKGKRRAMDQHAEKAEHAASISTPMGNNKRKASVSEEQPAKMQKSTPSSAKSLFEKIANKPAFGNPTKESTAAAKPSIFNANKPATSSSLARSVFTNPKPAGAQTTTTGGSNIFGYLSDASSAKNSGVDADAENEPDSDQDESQEAGQSDGPSVAASNAGDAGSQIGSSLFGGKPALPAAGLGAGSSSAPGTRESTPGRSLFDRVTKDSGGRPVRAEERVEEPEAGVAVESESQAESQSQPVQEKSAVADQTWNPTTTPIKFAPFTAAAPTTSLVGNSVGNSGANTTSSIFAPKATEPSNIFGAPKQEQSSKKDSSTGVNAEEASRDGGESDKENESQPAKKPLADTKTPAGQPAFGSSLFGAKPASFEAPKPVSALFGGSAAVATTTTAPKVDTKPAEASSKPSIFGQPTKPAEAAPTSSLFGTKPAETDKAPEAGASTATTSLFGGVSSKTAPESNHANNLFGAKPASTASSLFGSGASTPAQQPLFGATSATESTAVKTDAPKPIFNFGNTTSTTTTTAPSATASKPLFGAPKSPTPAAAGNNLFGSPMKQDDPSPAKKKVFNGGSNGDSAPAFGFGGGSQPAAPNTNLFGASSASTQNNDPAGATGFGGASTNTGSGSGGFNFNFGGGASTAAAATTTTTSGSGFNNPFASGGAGGNSATSAAPSNGGMFSFGAGSSAPPGTSSPFQFGAGGGSIFGANQGINNAAPMFGGASGTGSAPSFNFSAGGAAPQGTGSVFGSNQAAPAFNLQPPAGGSTTTGTNSPLNLGGGSSLATTPAAGTPEPSAQTDAAKTGDANNEEGEKHEQINLADAVDEDEEVLHEVRAKVLKFVPALGKSDDADDPPKSKSPWSTQGVGQLRLLKHKETKLVRLLLRAEPRGHVALNRAVLPNMSYKADEKYAKLTTSNEKGNGLETWMIQVKTKDLAKDLAEAIEKNKESNKT
ncbi:hypothetical protein EsDP_00002288 [Epichloe bromicola]|uniref:RanBD1 domain-containing protein n=1 Tax=Epichloe bromicola TaxID=79588 RepID=A0ABQ0CKB8_9HYPO